MKKINKVLILTLLIVTLYCNQVSAYSTRHHIINMGRNLIKSVFAPLYGFFVKGPKDIKDAYEYEVYGSDKPEKRGLLRQKLFAIWSSPGIETKAIIDGSVDSVSAAGGILKEFLNIFISD